MIYRDKSREELEAVLEMHSKSFEERLGKKPDLKALKSWALKKYETKVEEAREGSFGHLSPKSLETLIDLLSLQEFKADHLDKAYSFEQAETSEQIEEFNAKLAMHNPVIDNDPKPKRGRKPKK